MGKSRIKKLDLNLNGLDSSEEEKTEITEITEISDESTPSLKLTIPKTAPKKNTLAELMKELRSKSSAGTKPWNKTKLDSIPENEVVDASAPKRKKN